MKSSCLAAKNPTNSHLGNKEALILATTLRHQRFMVWLEALLADAETDEAVIQQLFSGLERWFQIKKRP